MRNEHHTARRGRGEMRMEEVSTNTARTSHISATRVCCATHRPPCVHLRRCHDTSGAGWQQTHHKMTYPAQPPAATQRNTELRWQMRAPSVLCGTGVRRDWHAWRCKCHGSDLRDTRLHVSRCTEERSRDSHQRGSRTSVSAPWPKRQFAHNARVAIKASAITLALSARRLSIGRNSFSSNVFAF